MLLSSFERAVGEGSKTAQDDGLGCTKIPRPTLASRSTVVRGDVDTTLPSREKR